MAKEMGHEDIDLGRVMYRLLVTTGITFGFHDYGTFLAR
jgi:hypothetical protein